MSSSKYPIAQTAKSFSERHAAKAEDKSIGRMMRLDMLEPDPRQPRLVFEVQALEELASSITAHGGVLEPILVNRDNQIIAGERRWKAAQMAGMTQIPVIFRDEMDERTVLKMQLEENTQRDQLSVVEVTLSVLRLISLATDATLEEAKALVYSVRRDEQHPQRALVLEEVRAARVSLNTFAGKYLTVLNLPSDLLGLVKAKRIDPTIALAINRIPQEQQAQAIENVLNQGWGLRDIEALILKPEPKQPTKLTKQFASLAKSVSLKAGKKGSSSLTLEFKDRQQLETILEKLGVELDVDALLKP
jgi:ParB family transcriptional regulator, chromosome partitioning protein